MQIYHSPEFPVIIAGGVAEIWLLHEEMQRHVMAAGSDRSGTNCKPRGQHDAKLVSWGGSSEETD